MRKTPDEIACDWVRDRLPLMAAEDAPAPDEAVDDRRVVEAHLAGCAPCRARRDGLTVALDALSAAAAESPVEPHAPSLWPALQARIAAQAAGPRPRKSAESRRPDARSRRPAESTAPRTIPTWADRAAAACDRRLLPLAGPVGGMAAAALLALFVGLPLADRSRSESDARIRAASEPLPAPSRTLPLVVASSRPEASTAADTPPPADLALLDDRSLARSDEPPLLDPDGRPLDAPRPAPAPATPPAVRFDLDRGIPMPPDARVDRPAY